jgi:hypothetical protein
MNKGVFKNISFILLLISLVIMSVVLIDILTLSKESQYVYHYSIIWVCNLAGCIIHIFVFNKTGALNGKNKDSVNMYPNTDLACDCKGIVEDNGHCSGICPPH